MARPFICSAKHRTHNQSTQRYRSTLARWYWPHPASSQPIRFCGCLTQSVRLKQLRAAQALPASGTSVATPRTHSRPSGRCRPHHLGQGTYRRARGGQPGQRSLPRPRERVRERTGRAAWRVDGTPAETRAAAAARVRGGRDIVRTNDSMHTARSRVLFCAPMTRITGRCVTLRTARCRRD